MPDDSSDPTLSSNLSWAGLVWRRLTRLQCAGVLHIALRYGWRETDTNAYIDSMAMMAWAELGPPLQIDVTRALLDLQRTFGR